MKPTLRNAKNQTLKYIIRIFLLVILSSVTFINQAKIKDILPTGLQLSFDVPRPLYYRWKEKTGLQYEINGSLDFNRILIDGDYGWGNILRKNPPTKLTALAENIGQYFRVGLSYNFIKNSIDQNAAFLGVKYSKAYFKDYLYGKLRNKKINIDQNARLQARWFEIVAGVRVKVWGWIYTGCTARYKFAKKISNTDSQIPFDIIGWGMNDDDNDAFGINFYMGIRVPLQATSSSTQSTEEIVTTSKRQAQRR